MRGFRLFRLTRAQRNLSREEALKAAQKMAHREHDDGRHTARELSWPFGVYAISDIDQNISRIVLC